MRLILTTLLLLSSAAFAEKKVIAPPGAATDGYRSRFKAIAREKMRAELCMLTLRQG